MKKLIIGILSMGILNFASAQCPQASFTSTAPACQSTLVDFTNTSPGATAATGYSFFWDFDYPNQGGATPSFSTSENPTGIDYSNGGNGVYTVALTISKGSCSSTYLLDIDIRRARADFSSSANTACVGEEVTFFNQGTPGSSPSTTVTHSWSFGTGATPSTSNLPDPPVVTYSTPGAKTILHYVSVDYGSCGGFREDTYTQTVVINDRPTVSFSSTAPVCEGNNVDFTYTGTTSSIDQYNWDFGTGAFPAMSSAKNPVGVSYSGSGIKSVNLTVTNQFGCVNSASQNISINGLPAITAGADTTICANTSVQIGGSNISGVSYSWMPSNSTVISDPSISNPVASPVAGSTEYIVTGVDANNCTNTDTILVTMLAPLNVNAGIDEVICRYDSTQIGASLVEGQLYSWSPLNGLSSPASPNTMVSPDSTTTYTLSVTDNYGCSIVTDEVTVIVNQLPLANAGPDDSITVNHSVQLVATGGIQYSWLPELGLSNAGIDNPVASPDSTTTYIVSVIDVNGCEQTDTVTVVVITPSFWAPTAFSPDGDMLNDVFYIRGDGIDNFEFTVFDQYGHLIFKSKNLSYGWDGSYATTGEKLPKGAYVYHVSGVLSDGTLVNETGMVNLIR